MYLVKILTPNALYSVICTPVSVVKLWKFDLQKSYKGWLPQSQKTTASKYDDEAHCCEQRLVNSLL
jgi:hypothetical protein